MGVGPHGPLPGPWWNVDRPHLCRSDADNHSCTEFRETMAMSSTRCPFAIHFPIFWLLHSFQKALDCCDEIWKSWFSKNLCIREGVGYWLPPGDLNIGETESEPWLHWRPPPGCVVYCCCNCLIFICGFRLGRHVTRWYLMFLESGFLRRVSTSLIWHLLHLPGSYLSRGTVPLPQAQPALRVKFLLLPSLPWRHSVNISELSWTISLCFGDTFKPFPN